MRWAMPTLEKPGTMRRIIMRRQFSLVIILCWCSLAFAASKETVTIDFAVKSEPITHKSAAFARGLTLTEPPQDMLAALHPVFFRQPALDAPAKYGALAIYPRAKNL